MGPDPISLSYTLVDNVPDDVIEFVRHGTETYPTTPFLDWYWGRKPYQQAGVDLLIPVKQGEILMQNSLVYILSM